MDTRARIWLIAGLIATLQLLTVKGYVDPIKEVRREGTEGRVEYIKAVVQPSHLPGGTCHQGTGTKPNVKAYAKKMGCDEDHAGHLIARCMGGTGDETYNIIPQNPSSNRHWFWDVEKKVFDLVHGGKTVIYEITPVYNGDIHGRPSTLHYKVSDFHNPSTVLMKDKYDNPEPNPCTH